MKRITVKMSKVIPAFGILIALLFCVPVFASDSDVVLPSGEQNSSRDVKNITRQLQKTGTVTLEKGGTYYFASPIKLEDGLKKNITINANGTTVIAKKDIITNIPKKKNYSDINHITIDGGTWKAASGAGYKGSSFAFLHGSDIVLKNMNVTHTNYDGHAFEFIACKNVTMDRITISPRGKKNKSFEAMVQIDIATNATAPRLKGTGLVNGAICKNVTVTHSKIKGNRTITTGWAYKDAKWKNKAHTGITITNNTLTSSHGEGLALTNVKNATISHNTILSKYNKTSKVKSCGVHILTMGKIKNTKYIM